MAPPVTRELPRVTEPAAPTRHPTGASRADGSSAGGRGGARGRTGAKWALLAAAGVGIVVVGVGAGVMLSEGGDDPSGGPQVSEAAPAAEVSPPATPSVDPARSQAEALDALLAESGTGRETVIGAVADVKSCSDLAAATRDLRAAADQRTGLVERLEGLSIDLLPDHAALATALTKAWQASASADEHYASWAEQAAGSNGCRKGKARTTGRTEAGNRASGTASAEKAKAAELWNSIARQHGLTERQPTQL
ncbi:hypothetical protein AAH978_14930 [Streptomyces sp. ZYX-F-203]